MEEIVEAQGQISKFFIELRNEPLPLLGRRRDENLVENHASVVSSEPKSHRSSLDLNRVLGFAML